MVTFDHLNVTGKMQRLHQQELLLIRGGATFSGTLLNASSKAIDLVLDLGRSLGTTIRMWLTGSRCPL